MNAKKLPLFFIFLTFSTLSFAAPQVITLKDGSRINGELVGMANGVYTVRTSFSGDVNINSSDVSDISTAGAPAPEQQANATPPAAQNIDVNQKMQAMQAQVMANPEMVAQITQLAQDPEIMKLLSDPSLVQAVTNKDVNAIASNPNGKQLMNNPKMKAIMQQVQGSSSQQPQSQQ